MRKQQNFRRISSGGAIAESALAVGSLCALLLFTICLMTFIAVFMHKRIQLEHVAQQAAQLGINRVYYAGLPRGATDAQVETETANIIKPILTEMGFTGTTMVYKTKLIGKRHYGEILLSADTLPFKSGGIPVLSDILPIEVTLVDSAMAIESNAVPPYVTAITMQGGRSARIFVPAIAGGAWHGEPQAAWEGSLAVPLTGPPSPGYGLITTSGAATASINHVPNTPSPPGEY
jgi:hypothetical protein